jgi:hypothetical protein
MHLIFSFPDGRRMEGILLAVSPDQIRIAITGEEDAVEFRRLDGYWNTEDGVHIELESVITDGFGGDAVHAKATGEIDLAIS